MHLYFDRWITVFMRNEERNDSSSCYVYVQQHRFTGKLLQTSSLQNTSKLAKITRRYFTCSTICSCLNYAIKTSLHIYARCCMICNIFFYEISVNIFIRNTVNKHTHAHYVARWLMLILYRNFTVYKVYENKNYK